MKTLSVENPSYQNVVYLKTVEARSEDSFAGFDRRLPGILPFKYLPQFHLTSFSFPTPFPTESDRCPNRRSDSCFVRMSFMISWLVFCQNCISDLMTCVLSRLYLRFHDLCLSKLYTWFHDLCFVQTVFMIPCILFCPDCIHDSMTCVLSRLYSWFHVLCSVQIVYMIPCIVFCPDCIHDSMYCVLSKLYSWFHDLYFALMIYTFAVDWAWNISRISLTLIIH